MRIVIGSDAEGMPLKETVKAYLIERGDEVVDKSEQPAADFVDSATAVAHDLMDNPDSLGFAFDRYGAGSYMAACKVKGIILRVLGRALGLHDPPAQQRPHDCDGLGHRGA